MDLSETATIEQRRNAELLAEFERRKAVSDFFYSPSLILILSLSLSL